MTTQNPANRPRALIAMSGGVDSSVAACLMQQAGYDCTGITMRLTHNETLGQSGYQTCCSEKDIEDAAEVAFALDMPYQVLDFTADFRAQIIEKFIRVYETGGTPNPCIDCNKYMKFRHLLDWAEEHGMEYVVTGHYARVEQDAETGRWLLKKGLDEGKDQSYVLYNLTQEQLAHIRLPLGALHKTEVRKEMQLELKRLQREMNITFIYVTHDQEEALTMSDTVVVMNGGKVQQIGTPEDIYNEPKNAFVADFIGDSNIVDGVMHRDFLVSFSGVDFPCVDRGFAREQSVQVVVRPEDIEVVSPVEGQLVGVVNDVIFKGVHFEMHVECEGREWLIHSTRACTPGETIGMRIGPNEIHIMARSEG